MGYRIAIWPGLRQQLLGSQRTPRAGPIFNNDGLPIFLQKQFIL
jgi:hypothetical protein